MQISNGNTILQKGCLSEEKNAPGEIRRRWRVDDGARTHDTRNHNPMLYQLNYIHHVI